MYSTSDVNRLINAYIDKGGECVTLEEGVLGHGTLMLFGYGLKCCVVKEVYINEWSSGHTVRYYNSMPKKYERLMLEVI